MPCDRIVFDLEILHSIGDVVDGHALTWEDTDKLGISLAAVWEERTDTFQIYGPDETQSLRHRVEAADEVISFNGALFDAPVLYGMAKGPWKEGHDLACPITTRNEF